MESASSKTFITQLLQLADVQLDGVRPWDIQVHQAAFYDRVLKSGALGLGEAYMAGWWDCAALDQFFDRIIRANLERKIKKNKSLLLKLFLLKMINRQTKQRALEVGKKHYDVGNELFQFMLDSKMNYTCAYWKTATTLEEAQAEK